MSDGKRLNLSEDLEKITGDLLKDVQDATEQVKKRKAADKARDEQNAEKSKSNKTSALIIGIAAVVLIIVAYFVVFAKPGEPENPGTINGAVQQKNGTVQQPGMNRNVPQAPPKTAPTPSAGRSASQQHPSDDYEQPAPDNGM